MGMPTRSQRHDLPGISHASLVFAIPAYTILKPALGRPPEVSPPSFSEVIAGYTGFSDSLSLLPGGDLEFTNKGCGCE